MVAGGIAGGIGFDFNDAAADATLREIVDKNFADEELRECDGVAGQFGTAKPADTRAIFQVR
jgi:hypothetical protein